MAYKFAFDLTGFSRSFFREVAKVSDQRGIHRKIGDAVERIVQRFNVQAATGLPVADAVTLVNDLVDIYARNLAHEERFRQTKKRALLLPHCSRKYMDRRCQAEFNPEFSTYECKHCSKDCLVGQAVTLGERLGYDVYILPGGSCIHKILSKRSYDAIVGVACPNEIQLGIKQLGDRMPYQAIPLLKNGCANTSFNLDTLEQVLAKS